VLNSAAFHKDIWENETTVLHFLNLQTEVSSNLQVSASLPLRKTGTGTQNSSLVETKTTCVIVSKCCTSFFYLESNMCSPPYGF
jgi:hypothetical protein